MGETGGQRAKNITYYCDIQEAKQFGDLVWATGCRCNADLAKELIFLGDGAAWIWKLVERHFPHAVQIVDWRHAEEYLEHLAEAAFGSKQTQAEQWFERVRTDLAETLYNLARQQVAFEQWLAHHDSWLDVVEGVALMAHERLDQAAGVVRALQLRVYGPYQVIGEEQAVELAELVKVIARTLSEQYPSKNHSRCVGGAA